MLSLRFLLLVLVVLVIGHDATYAVANGVAGLGAALRGSGHDGYWFPTMLLAASGLVLAAGITSWRWGSLRRELRRRGWRDVGTRRYDIRQAGSRAARLYITVLAVFLVQENLEHYMAHAGHAPGLGVFFGDGYAATLPAFAVLALAVAALAELITSRTRTLERELERASKQRQRPATKLCRPETDPLVVPPAITSQPDLGRAPPVPTTVLG